jgi:hypothetical protein
MHCEKKKLWISCMYFLSCYFSTSELWRVRFSAWKCICCHIFWQFKLGSVLLSFHRWKFHLKLQWSCKESQQFMIIKFNMEGVNYVERENIYERQQNNEDYNHWAQ